MSRAQVSQPSALLQAFADPTRLRILNLLHEADMCVGDLVSVLRVPQPTASRHLMHLRAAGLVQARKQGLWVFYALAKSGSPFHARLIDCLGCCFQEVPELQADLERAGRLRRAGGCCPLHEVREPARRPRAARRAARCCP